MSPSWAPCAKTNPRVTGLTVVLVVTKDTNSCFRPTSSQVTLDIEPLPVAAALQRSTPTNQRFPRSSTQRSGAVFPVSDQRVQRVGIPVDDKGSYPSAEFHNEADLGEGCTPVGRQLGLTMVEPSLPSCTVEVRLVGPEFGIVMEGSLEKKGKNSTLIA